MTDRVKLSTMTPIRLIALLPLLLLGACDEDETAVPTIDVVDAFPALQFDQPVFLTSAPGDDERLFVVTKPGIIHVFENDPAVATSKVFLDFSERVLTNDDMGMHGLAFDPGFQDNNSLYVSYNPRTRGAASPRRTDIARFGLSEDREAANPFSQHIIFSIEQPGTGDKAAWLGFGPDGKLYVASGDGSNGGDPDNAAQNIGSGLGKILRMNTDGRVPPDNPFARFSSPDARGLVWAFGLRNPYGASFDRATGELWVGDQGLTREEVDVIVKGGNYGWRKFEGSVLRVETDPDVGVTIPPLLEYERQSGGRCGIIGGYVYRGTELGGDAVGHYFFADRCTREISFMRGSEATVVATVPGEPTSFGEDAAGELYVTSRDGHIYKLVPGDSSSP
jgi:glucose/arabinose dehydrogenase